MIVPNCVVADGTRIGLVLLNVRDVHQLFPARVLLQNRIKLLEKHLISDHEAAVKSTAYVRGPGAVQDISEEHGPRLDGVGNGNHSHLPVGAPEGKGHAAAGLEALALTHVQP